MVWSCLSGVSIARIYRDLCTLVALVQSEYGTKGCAAHCAVWTRLFFLFLPKNSVDRTIKPLEVVLLGPQEDAAARIDEQGRTSDERLDDIDLNVSATADPTAQSSSDLAQQQQDGAQNAVHNAAHTSSNEQPASVLVRYPYSWA